jgi:hypothetical protein
MDLRLKIKSSLKENFKKLTSRREKGDPASPANQSELIAGIGFTELGCGGESPLIE